MNPVHNVHKVHPVHKQDESFRLLPDTRTCIHCHRASQTWEIHPILTPGRITNASDAQYHAICPHCRKPQPLKPLNENDD